MARRMLRIPNGTVTARRERAVGNDIEPARAYGPYHLITEAIGGKTLANAQSLLGLPLVVFASLKRKVMREKTVIRRRLPKTNC